MRITGLLTQHTKGVNRPARPVQSLRLLLLSNSNPAVALGHPGLAALPRLRKPLALYPIGTGGQRTHIVRIPTALDLNSRGVGVVERNSGRGREDVLNVIRICAGSFVDLQNRSSALITITSQLKPQ